MLLWICFGVISAAVLAALLRPLLGREDACAPAPDLDTVAVYRDQLAEIDAEREQGLITGTDAEAARVEIARRLLAADAATAAAPAVPARRVSTRVLAGAVTLGLPLASIVIYMLFGSPGLPAAPESDRAALRATVAAVEERLRTHPEEGQGWAVLGPAYMKLERFADAAKAYGRANQLLGDTSERLASLVDASRAAHDGRFADEARLALEKLVALEPRRMELRMWLAVARQQVGQLAEAEADLDKLLQSPETPAVWHSLISERLEAVRAMRQGEVMVQRLAERLRAEGGDLAGWQRLIRAYAVLGRKADALSALGEARTRFKSEAQTLSALDEFARSLGLES